MIDGETIDQAVGRRGEHGQARRRSRHGDGVSEAALRRSLSSNFEKEKLSVRKELAVVFAKMIISAIAIDGRGE